MTDSFLFALAMTAAAGLSTGVGSLVAFFSKSENSRFMGFCMGFSAGVMIFVSMGELLPKGQSLLGGEAGAKIGYGIALLAFFGGMLLCLLLEKILPEKPNEEGNFPSKMTRTGLVTALALSLHNFPEGMATFLAALEEQESALPVVVAIAVHNIPEGISVSLPLAAGGMKKGKAFFLSLLSGLTEPLGAVIGFLLLAPFLCDALMGGAYAAVAGLMMWISFDELLPSAEESGGHGLTLAGLFAGMAVMGLSLWLFL